MRSLIVAALAALLALPAAWAEQDKNKQDMAPEHPEPWQRLGLMRIRDMTPFGLARLDFLPAHAVTATPGSYAIESTLSYQNTWARSDNVADWLAQRGLERAALTPEDMAAIIDLPGDAYLVDGEYGLLDLTLHYRVNRHLGVYTTIPYFFFDTGLLDGTVERFHGAFGFGNAGREFVPYNQWQAVADLQGSTTVQSTPPRSDFGDPVFGLRYSLRERPQDWNLIAEAAIKLPRHGAESFVSTGATDYGLQLSWQRFLAHHAFYLTVSGVYYAGPDPRLAHDQWIPTAIAGWETQVTRRVGLVLQVYASRSTVQNTDLSELSADKLQATIGLQWSSGGNVLRLGLTENLGNFNNTPDVGVTVSVGRIIFH